MRTVTDEDRAKWLIQAIADANSGEDALARVLEAFKNVRDEQAQLVMSDDGKVGVITMPRHTSPGWRRRLETVRRIPREGVKSMMISAEMLDDVIAALDHLDEIDAEKKVLQ